jgi:hypothetical protein
MGTSSSHPVSQQITADPHRLIGVLNARFAEEAQKSAILEAGLAEALATRDETARLLADGARLVRELFRANANVDPDAAADGFLRAAIGELGGWHEVVTGNPPGSPAE